MITGLYVDITGTFNTATAYYGNGKINYRKLLSEFNPVVARAYGYKHTPSKDVFIRSLERMGYHVSYSHMKRSWPAGVAVNIVNDIHRFGIDRVILVAASASYVNMVMQLPILVTVVNANKDIALSKTAKDHVSLSNFLLEKQDAIASDT